MPNDVFSEGKTVDIDLSVRLEGEYDEELDDEASDAFLELKEEIETQVWWCKSVEMYGEVCEIGKLELTINLYKQGKA